MRIGVLTFILCTAVRSLSQENQRTDSLKRMLSTTSEDTQKVNLYTRLFREYRSLGNQDGALKYALTSEKLASKLNYKPGLIPALSVIGNIYTNKGNLTQALQYHHRSMELKKELRDSVGISASYNSIGNVYLNMGLHPQALDNYLASLKMAEKIRYYPSMTISLNNIVIIYNTMGEFKKSEKQLDRALEISEKINHKLIQVNIYNNYGNIYSAYYKDIEKARGYYEKALLLSENLADEHSLAISLGNIGITYDDEGNYDRALDYCLRSLKKHTETENIEKIAYMSVTVGNIYRKLKKMKEALKYTEEGLALAKSINSLDDMMDAEKTLTDIYEDMGDARAGLVHYKAYIAARDSAFNEENTKKLVRSEMNFEFEKKEAQAELEQEKKEAVAAAERKKQKIILLAVSGFGLLILAFAFFAYRSFLQKKKANVEISRQKEIIEEKQKEILDSIRYAKRIQYSLMSSEKYIERCLTELRSGK